MVIDKMAAILSITIQKPYIFVPFLNGFVKTIQKPDKGRPFGPDFGSPLYAELSNEALNEP